MTTAHPRVEARRAAVAKKRSRARGRIAVVLLMLFSLAGLAWLLVQSSALDLETVKVEGARRVRADDVRSTAAVDEGEPLLLVDRGAVARRVERLPWVADASVRFSIPGTLVVRVTERQPVAWIALGRDGEPAGEGVSLVDADGRVLDHRTQPPERLLQLRVDVAVPEPGRRVQDADGALRIAATVPESLRERVRAITPAKGGYVLDLVGADIVRFGAARDLPEKWSALEAVVERLGDRTVYLIDVRVPSVPAVRETEVVVTTTTAPPPPPDGEPDGTPDAGADARPDAGE